jgi:ABC-type branched-subunit amino acid transport system substrate-binding protein
MLVGLPTLLAGCGGASTGIASGANATCPAVPGVTPTSVTVGFIYPDSGPSGTAIAFEAARSAAQARVDLQNAHGGVRGRHIELVWGDDKSDPSVFNLTARDLVQRQNVFGLAAVSTALSETSAGWLAKLGVPVTGVATSALWSDPRYPNLFTNASIFNPGTVSVYGDFVKEQGGTRAVILTDPTVADSAALAQSYGASLQSRGVQVVAVIPFSSQVTSAASVAARIVRLGADTLLGAGQIGPFIDVYALVKSQIKVALNTYGYDPATLAARGAAMAGMSVVLSHTTSDSPAMRAYESAISQYAPELTNPSDELGLAGYVAADAMITGLDLAGTCPTRQAFIADMRKVTDFSGAGLLPPADLSHPRNPSTCEAFVKVDPTGHAFVGVAPPPSLDKGGFWCGQVVSSQ